MRSASLDLLPAALENVHLRARPNSFDGCRLAMQQAALQGCTERVDPQPIPQLQLEEALQSLRQHPDRAFILQGVMSLCSNTTGRTSISCTQADSCARTSHQTALIVANMSTGGMDSWAALDWDIEELKRQHGESTSLQIILELQPGGIATGSERRAGCSADTHFHLFYLWFILRRRRACAN